MARGDGLKNYENLDLKDAKNDNRLTEVYRDWAKKYDYTHYHKKIPILINYILRDFNL